MTGCIERIKQTIGLIVKYRKYSADHRVFGAMAESADATDLKSVGGNT